MLVIILLGGIIGSLAGLACFTEYKIRKTKRKERERVRNSANNRRNKRLK